MMTSGEQGRMKVMLEMKVKCVMGHKFTMNEQMIARANDFGCAMCPACGMPATVEKVTLDTRKTKQRKAEARK